MGFGLGGLFMKVVFLGKRFVVFKNWVVFGGVVFFFNEVLGVRVLRI